VHLNGTVARDFEGNFFTPIDRPDLGDGPLRGVNFERCACAKILPKYALKGTVSRESFVRI